MKSSTEGDEICGEPSVGSGFRQEKRKGERVRNNDFPANV